MPLSPFHRFPLHISPLENFESLKICLYFVGFGGLPMIVRWGYMELIAILEALGFATLDRVLVYSRFNRRAKMHHLN